MSPQLHILAFLQSIGAPEVIVIGIVALLIFGRRLPEVGRSFGRSIVEFKRGLKDVQGDAKKIGDDIDRAADNVHSYKDDHKKESSEESKPDD